MALQDLFEMRKVTAGKLIRVQEKLRNVMSTKQREPLIAELEMIQTEFIYLNSSIIKEQNLLIDKEKQDV